MRARSLAGGAIGVLAVGLLLATTPAIDRTVDHWPRIAHLAVGYAGLIATSGVVVRGALRYAGTEPIPETADTGRAVGKIENVLVLTLTLLGAYTALAIVFTAKSIVRWEDLTSENTTYYLTGSIANVTYSLVWGIALRILVLGSV